MFDILVYLFENYVHADACPEPAQLARKLTAAGFEEDEIADALEWLSGLRQLSDADRRRQHVVLRLEVVFLFGEATDGAGDVRRNRRFLSDDQLLAHARGATEDA